MRTIVECRHVSGNSHTCLEELILNPDPRAGLGSGWAGPSDCSSRYLTRRYFVAVLHAILQPLSYTSLLRCVQRLTSVSSCTIKLGTETTETRSVLGNWTQSASTRGMQAGKEIRHRTGGLRIVRRQAAVLVRQARCGLFQPRPPIHVLLHVLPTAMHTVIRHNTLL
jgi:hypothetical protein